VIACGHDPMTRNIEIGFAFRSEVRVYRRFMDEEQARDERLRVPAGCTLSPAQQPVRAAEWSDLFGAAVLNIRRVSSAAALLELWPDPLVAAQVADLAAREARCCSFFTFNQTVSGGKLTLEIGVPSEQVATLDALLGLAPAGTAGVS